MNSATGIVVTLFFMLTFLSCCFTFLALMILHSYFPDIIPDEPREAAWGLAALFSLIMFICLKLFYKEDKDSAIRMFLLFQCTLFALTISSYFSYQEYVYIEELNLENDELSEELTKLQQELSNAQSKLTALKKQDSFDLQGYLADHQTISDEPKVYHGDGPNGEGIKGHIGKNGKIYHIPGSTYYDHTKKVSEWFFTEEDAQAAGYRPPEK